MTRTIDIGKIKMGGDQPLVLICGPCVYDQHDQITQCRRAHS